MVKEGKADALVTMGSTGAAMAAAAVLLGVINGVDRPALGGPILGLAPRTAVIDVGTNVDCRPAQLLSFAVIGDVFARQFWGVESPRVALLSVGAEAGKGNRQVRETSGLIARSGLNFVGNIEANDLPRGAADVAVCDGFVGNVVMKLAEGIGLGLSERLRELLSGKLPEVEVERVAREVYDLNNVVETYGGGPLFGVNGVSVVGHGRGNAESVRRAIDTAKTAVKNRFVEQLNRELELVRDKLGNPL
jgi:glycerol-3-phosphate acyltransferase PlsX